MRINKRHSEAIELLIEGTLTKEQIAKNVHVSRSTLYKWLEDEDFTAEYEYRLEEIERQPRRMTGRSGYLTRAATIWLRRRWRRMSLTVRDMRRRIMSM